MGAQSERTGAAGIVWLLTCVAVGVLALACDDEHRSAQPDLPDDTATADLQDLGRSDTVVDIDVHTEVDAPDAETFDPMGCSALTTSSDAHTATLGDWQVMLDAGTGAWSITPIGQGDPVLEGPGSCVVAADGSLLAGIRAGDTSPSVNNSFGAFEITLLSQRIAAAQGAPTVVSGADALSGTWSVTQADHTTGTITLRFALQPSGGLLVALEASDPTWQAGELAMRCRPDEEFFGLGTQSVGMGLRGRRYPLWTQEQGVGKPESGGIFPLNNIPEASYAPMGVWHSSAGYAAVVGYDGFSTLDLCAAHDDRMVLTAYPDLPSFVLMPGTSPRERLTAITELVGRIDRVPAWVFAPWNVAVGGQARLDEVRTRLRAEHIPSSAIWSEDWAGTDPGTPNFDLSYTWDWDPSVYPELPATLDVLHAQGFAFLAYFNPFVLEGSWMWDEAVAGGFLVEDSAGEAYDFLDPGFRKASYVDLTDEGAVAWTRGHLETAAAMGIDGWMVDFGEWLPVDGVLASQASPWREHNRYPWRWQQVQRDALEAVHATASDGPDNWTTFARSGWASVHGGTAGLAPTMWGGDQNTDWSYDDGLPTVVPLGAHVGLAGVAIFGSDIGGFATAITPPTTKELFLRWSTLGALSPLMRTHHGLTECSNWSFDRDAETIAHFRRWASVHTLLYPTFTTLLQDARTRGWPVIRHPFLVEPTRAGFWSGDGYEFFVGDDLLVAPVLHEHATDRRVTLPESGWWPLFGDAPTSGEVGAAGQVVQVTVAAGPTELPVFVRPGSALVLLGEVVDSFYGASDSGVTDLGDVAGQYRVALYPAANGEVRATTARGLDGGALCSVAGGGWGAQSLASTPQLDGVELPSCSGVASAESCYDASTRMARVVATSALLTMADGATLQLSANTVTTWQVGVAGDAWGALATPTGVTELAPDVPPPCLP